MYIIESKFKLILNSILERNRRRRKKPINSHKFLTENAFLQRAQKHRLTVELWQMIFSKVCRSSNNPLAAEVDKSHPLSSKTLSLPNGNNESGIGSREGGGNTETTFNDGRSLKILRSCSSERWSPRSDT